ncbi:tigger transposable element-derived protein 1-like isoform X2 [Malaya genurostris]|nr:tigger transposable element-derived protein 1-like isoform X2 [Malaya genurostris]
MDQAPSGSKQRRVLTIAEKLNILNQLSSGRGSSELAHEYNVHASTIRNIHKHEFTIRTMARSRTRKKYRQRRTFSLTEKLNILNRLESGHTATALGIEYNVNESTIRNMRRQEPSIRSMARLVSSDVAAGSMRKRNPRFGKMETCLAAWRDDMRTKRLVLYHSKIRAKALELYERIGEDTEYADGNSFHGSNGWFERFKNKHGLFEIRPHKDRIPPDEVEFKLPLQQMLSTLSFSRSQFFSVESTIFTWKQLPGLAGEARSTLIFCSNASGDFVTRPTFINDSEQSKADSPITERDLETWFETVFVSEVDNYVQGKMLPFQVVLILPHNQNCSPNLKRSGVDVRTLPSNCNSSCLPAVQGILTHLNAVYLRQVCQWLASEVSTGRTLQKSWASFSSKDAEMVLQTSIVLLDESALRNGWSCLLDAPMEQHSNDEIVHEIVANLHELGLSQVTAKDIFHQITPRELTNEELLEMFRKQHEDGGQYSIETLRQNQQSAAVVDNWQVQLTDYTPEIRHTLIEKIDRHLTELARAEDFFDMYDLNRKRAKGVSGSLLKVAAWAREMKDELMALEQPEEIAIEIKEEVLMLDSSDDDDVVVMN